MRTLIFGAKGQLGKDLLQVFAEHGSVAGYDLPELDITDAKVVRDVVEDTCPDLVINAAAYTDVEGAETHREEAFAVNETGARNVAAAAASRHVPTIYYSTDFVFAGDRNTPYEPHDTPAPSGVYAASKLAGENAVVHSNPAFFVIRTAWLFGPGKNNFVEKIIQAASTRPELRVVEDEVGSPTYTLDLARATYWLCKTQRYGIYHIVNAGFCSRFEFAKAIVQGAGLSTPVYPCTSAERPSAVKRPAYSVLSTVAFEAVTGQRLRHWEAALHDYLNRRQRT